MAALITLQILELICYIILFHHITEHNREMQRNNIISADLFKARKHINIFSLYAQVFAFDIESTYFALNLVMKAIGRKYFPPSTREYSNVILTLLFCTNSTMQIFSSATLRQKFFAVLGLQVKVLIFSQVPQIRLNFMPSFVVMEIT